MSNTNCLELEELVLMTIASLTTGHAYSIAISDALEKNTGHTLKLSVVYRILYCLELKGLVSSRMGEATSLRGGNRKRYYALITATGVRDQLWNRIQDLI